MREIEREITKELYEDYAAMPYRAREKSIIDSLVTKCPEWVYGYGYYGHRLVQRGGKFYIVHRIGGHND